MAISLKHSTVVVVPDDGTSPVGTDEWNAEHNFTMDSGFLLGRASAGNGAVEQITNNFAPGGSNTQVQYNNSGVLGGSANFVWNNGTSVLTVTGQIVQTTGSANGIVAGGTIEGASYKCTGTIAAFGPTSAGSVVLRPNGVA